MAKTTTQTKPKPNPKKKKGVPSFTLGTPRWAQRPGAKGTASAMPVREIEDKDDFLGEEKVMNIQFNTSPRVGDRPHQTPVTVYVPPAHHRIRYPAVPPPGQRRQHSGPRATFQLFIPLDAPTPVIKVAKSLCRLDQQGLVELSGLSTTSVKEALKGGTAWKVGNKVLRGFQTAARSVGGNLSLDDLDVFFGWVREKRKEAEALPEGLRPRLKPKPKVKPRLVKTKDRKGTKGRNAK